MVPSLPLTDRLLAANELVDWKGLEIELLAWFTLLQASTHTCIHTQMKNRFWDKTTAFA